MRAAPEIGGLSPELGGGEGTQEGLSLWSHPGLCARPPLGLWE